MPRKKKTIVEETLPDTPSAIAEADDFASSVHVLTKVYRIKEGGKSFCFQTTEPVDEVLIQAQYPTGGKFVVLGFNTLNQVISTEHIDIEPKPMVSSNGSNDNLQTRVLLDELAFTRTMMMKMIEGMTTGRVQQQTPLGELAQAMSVVHEMSSKTDPSELILKGMELGIKSQGGGDKDWKAELVDAAKSIVPAVMTGTNRPQIAQGGQQQMISLSPIKQGLNWLKPQIIGGMTVDLAVGWVLQHAKEQPYNELLANAIQGDINTFIAIDSDFANEPYRTWLSSAIDLLKEEYAAAQQPNTDDSDTEGRAGNDTDGADNASTRIRKPKVTKVS